MSESIWQQGLLTPDGGETFVPGEFRTDYRWNGWLVPRLPWDSAVLVAQSLSPDEYAVSIDYESRVISYTLHDYADDGPEVFAADEDGMYHLGSMSWCWENDAEGARRVSKLTVGTMIVQRFGPYVALARIVELTERGAVLEYSSSAALDASALVETTSPDGATLAPAGRGFIGRAHFASVEALPRAEQQR